MADSKKVKNDTVKHLCTCVSEFQDAHYGQGMRMMNVCAKGLRCTVCGKEHFQANK